jgi:hypothetical protein
MQQKRGRITAAGITKDVTFEPVDGSINDRIDDAYRAKYKTSPYVPRLSPENRPYVISSKPGQRDWPKT